MTIIQMECFVEAAKMLNFTKAADNLYISRHRMDVCLRKLEKIKPMAAKIMKTG